MSRLIDPGPGEILDRLTILQLKLVYGWLKGMDKTHWAEEYVALMDRLVATHYPPSQQTWERMLDLAAVNAALWQAEDEMRFYRTVNGSDPDLEAAGEVGIRIQTLNDRRAELITLINTSAGIDRPSDKV